MMYKLSCKDLGPSDCDFVATGKTKEEVVKKMEKHAKEEHPDQFKDMVDKMGKEGVKNMMMDKMQEEGEEEDEMEM